MANTEHLSRLKQGVKSWNAWRAKNPDIYPNLAWADLHEADLKGVDLSGTYLSGADLHKANLSKANLRGCHLRKANLNGADLSGSALRRADIRGADLRFTNMKGTRLRAVSLNEADFTDAYLGGANFEAADLRGAENLAVEQLVQTVTLHGAVLDPGLMQRIQESHPQLFDEPKPLEIREQKSLGYLRFAHTALIAMIAGIVIFAGASAVLGVAVIIPSVIWLATDLFGWLKGRS